MQVLDFSADYQTSELSLGVMFFEASFPFLNVDFSPETLSEKIEHSVDENFEFEDRDKSKLLASFGFFGLSKNQPTERKLWVNNDLPMNMF